MPVAVPVLASLPSPDSGAIHLGSLQLRMYGLMIALGVIAAVWLAGRRLEQKGIGTRDQMASIALWAVPAGIIGARLYHVVTDWQLFRDDPVQVFAIWKGGLGIWGGIALGVAVGVWRAAKLGIPLKPGLDAVVPALPLAQAIGRLGNWWNQELFGRPTTLPWGLEISPANRPPGYEQFATFHPTFLYEALWNLLLCLALIWIDRKGWLRPGRLILAYVAGYTFIRFFIEGLRIDEANRIGGLRVNEWVSAIAFVLSVTLLVVDVVRHRHDPVVPDGGMPVPRDEMAGEASAGDALVPSDALGAADQGREAARTAEATTSADPDLDVGVSPGESAAIRPSTAADGQGGDPPGDEAGGDGRPAGADPHPA